MQEEVVPLDASLGRALLCDACITQCANSGYHRSACCRGGSLKKEPKKEPKKRGKPHTGTLPETEIPKPGIPKSGIPKTGGIPKIGIPKLGIPKTGGFTAP